mmetsp:Transcript_106450/g.227313  ORF Transcript_106450/g.227313 Transcript_106450/m.227313 type:complete len:250 (+) Transcript_106450:1282-2031(+)
MLVLSCHPKSRAPHPLPWPPPRPPPPPSGRRPEPGRRLWRLCTRPTPRPLPSGLRGGAPSPRRPSAPQPRPSRPPRRLAECRPFGGAAQAHRRSQPSPGAMAERSGRPHLPCRALRSGSPWRCCPHSWQRICRPAPHRWKPRHSVSLPPPASSRRRWPHRCCRRTSAPAPTTQALLRSYLTKMQVRPLVAAPEPCHHRSRFVPVPHQSPSARQARLEDVRHPRRRVPRLVLVACRAHPLLAALGVRTWH